MANHQCNHFIDAHHCQSNMQYSSLPKFLGSRGQSIPLSDGSYFYGQHQQIQMAPQKYFVQHEDRRGVNFSSQACQRQQQSSQQHQSQYVIENKALESATMLVVMQSGEQRLITFTMPKESCTVQELLDQVGVPYSPLAHIDCITNTGGSYDYLVTIGPCNETPTEIVSAAENTLQRQQQCNTTPKIIDARPQVKRKYPELSESPPPKLVPGFLAVCPNCGLCGIDHHRCIRCRTVFEESVKVIVSSGSEQLNVKKPKSIPPITTTEMQKKEMKHQISFDKRKNTFSDGTWYTSMQTPPYSSTKFNFNNQPLLGDRFVGSQFRSTFQHPATTTYGSDSLSPYHQVGFGLNNSSSMYPQSRQTYDSTAWHRHPKSLHQTSTSSAANSHDFNTGSSSAWMRNGQGCESIWSPEGTGLSHKMNTRQMESRCNNLENICESAVDKEEENESSEELTKSVNVREGEDFSCVVCQDERRNILILPCRHLCVCKECSTEIKLCPLCRNPIQELMTIFT